jgi:hypothetical protein
MTISFAGGHSIILEIGGTQRDTPIMKYYFMRQFHVDNSTHVDDRELANKTDIYVAVRAYAYSPQISEHQTLIQLDCEAPLIGEGYTVTKK